ncbi:MAG: DNA-binding protein [Oscillospiraceae bacterium]|nr:DNA-binding protein [Oscillospiraceae bacterium]
MKDNPVTMALLFDFYGETLTDKQKDYFDLYYGRDLSLSEISENEGITRQGVRDVISRAENTLRDLESRLGLVARYGHLLLTAGKLSEAAREILEINERRYINATIKKRAEEILRLAETLNGAPENGV